MFKLINNSSKLKYLFLLVFIQNYYEVSGMFSREEKRTLSEEEQRSIVINLEDIVISQAKTRLSEIKANFQEKMELPENKNFDLHDLLETSQDIDTFMAAHLYQFVDTIQAMIKNAEQVRDMVNVDANKKLKSRSISTLRRFLQALNANEVSTKAVKVSELAKGNVNEAKVFKWVNRMKEILGPNWWNVECQEGYNKNEWSNECELNLCQCDYRKFL